MITRRAYPSPSYTAPPWPPLHLSTTQSVSTFPTRSGPSSFQPSQPTLSPTPNRNNFLADRGIPLPRATSTGTTIVGCLFKDGIVLGADTRATEGDIVADKNCEKVSDQSPLLVSRMMSLPDPLYHRVHPMLWCRYRRGYRIHDGDDIQQHGTPCPIKRPEAQGCNCHDHAKAVPVPVGGSRVRFASDPSHPYQGIKVTSVLLWSSEELMPRVLISLRYTPTDRPISSHT